MDKKIIWTTEKRKLSELVGTPHNPRKLTKKEHAEIKKSLTKFGLAELPVINRNSNQILAGHMRTMILQSVYEKDYEIELRVPDRQLTKEECDEYLIRSNQNTGSFDFDKLKENFTFEELTEYGFEAYELVFMDTEETDTADNLTQSMDSYLDGAVKQVVLYFNSTEYEEIFRRLEKIREKAGLENNTQVFLKMLEVYKNNA